MVVLELPGTFIVYPEFWGLYIFNIFYFRGQRAKRTCWHVHLAVLCAGGTRLAPTETKCRPAARVKNPTVLLQDF